jgi:hypothetical protein
MRRLSLRLGLRNGLLIGLALALGAWAPDAVSLIASPVRLVLPSLLLGCLGLVLLGGLAGWLATWLRRAYASGLVWAVTAVLMTWTIGHLPYEGRSLMAWLADRRFWGLAVYPFDDAALIGLVMAGFFVMLLLTILGLLQDYRLEGLRLEVNADGRLTGRAWFGLLLPLPLVIGVGLIADHLVNGPLRIPPRLVHEVIRTGRTYSGNLFALSLERGVNYNAISGVRDQMSADYTLGIGEVNLGAADTVFVVADFDNDAWIYCRVVAEQLSNCFDARPPYQQGFLSLLTTGQILEDCPACYIRVSDEQRDWLLARIGNFVDSPRIARLAQQGSYVLMRAESPGSDYAVECLFNGLSPVRLEHCQEVRAANSTVGSIPSPTRLPLGTIRLDPIVFDPLDRLAPPPGGFPLPITGPLTMGPGTLARFQTAVDLVRVSPHF